MKRRRINLGNIGEKVITPIIFLLPSLSVYLVFTFGTLIYSFVLSFTDYDGLSSRFNFIGLANYIKLFKDATFYIALKNNVIWAAVSLIVPMFLGLFLAVLVDRKIRGENIFKSIFYLPQTLSFVVIGVIWSWVYEPTKGIINSTLSAIGLDSLAQQWIGDPGLTIYSLVLTGAWQITGYTMVLYLAGLRSISQDVIEASRIDGANNWQSFWYVVYPMLRNIRTVVIATIIINSFKIFDLVFTMTQGGPGEASNVLALFMYKEAFWKFRMSYGTAISVIQFLIIFIVVAVYLSRTIRQEGEV
ncbi:MAG: sugar ABC transporter permease [Actinobacteria bacterium]|nr:sugar ABC transporter permease [Actinomycetota bacterium]